MAISTSSTFLYLPGQDATQQSNMNVALNTNSNMLSILTSSASATGAATAITSVNAINAVVGSVATQSASQIPQVEPYPTFASFSNYQNTPGYALYNSDMEAMASAYLSTGTEIGQNYTGYNYTTGNIGANTVTTNWTSATCFSQAEGNWLVSVPGHIGAAQNGSYGVAMDAVNTPWSRFGTILGKVGIRQKWSIYTSDGNLGIYPFGGVNPLEMVGLNTSTYSNWFGGQAYGQVGYNDRTQTLVVLEGKDNNNNYRLHIWRNTNAGRSLNDPNLSTGVLNQFLVEAKTAGTPTSISQTVYYSYNDFQWQANNSQNYTESRFKNIVFPTDNGSVAIARMVPQNGFYMASYTPTLLVAGGTGTLNTSYNTLNQNNTYGIDSAVWYGSRHVQTWDNQWVAAYAPYYAYGSGMNVFFINTVDPTKYYYAQYGSTTNGCQLVPFKQDKFLFNDSQQNSDGNYGMRLWTVDIGAWYNNGVDWQHNTIANGASMGLTAAPVNTWTFDTRYSSTNYPLLLSPRHWTNG